VYPSDVTDEEWWFLLPYLLLCREDAGQREQDLREVFDAGDRAEAGAGYELRCSTCDPAYSRLQQEIPYKIMRHRL
jgi:hypothetical protein